MSIELFTLIAFCGALLAGLLGALTGLGGGVIIIPLLTLGLGVDMHYAIGASLISVMATSSGAAAAFVREGFTNIRLGMFLEVATTIGAAVGGAYLSTILPVNVIAILFGGILLFSAYMTTRKKITGQAMMTESKQAATWRLNSSYPEQGKMVGYKVRRIWAGFGMMGVAGMLSGLLGIGSGVIKVLAMDHVMKVPFKVSTTTSNFMIGVTAAASAVIYFQRGYIQAPVAAPVMIGVLIGAMVGAKLLVKLNSKYLRTGFAVVVVYLAIQMIYKGITGQH